MPHPILLVMFSLVAILWIVFHARIIVRYLFVVRREWRYGSLYKENDFLFSMFALHATIPILSIVFYSFGD